MKSLLKCIPFLIILASQADMAWADKVCLKITAVNNKIKQNVVTVASTAVCPKGSTQIVDTTLAGAIGLQGTQGPQGPAGGFVPTLPSGQLIKGVYGGFTNSAAAGNFFTDTQTFPYVLPSNLLGFHYIEPGGSATAQCPGTAAAPDALAGHLCLYEVSRSNRSLPTIFNTASGSATMDNSWRYGFTVWTTANAAGFQSMYGSYAVRAQ